MINWGINALNHGSSLAVFNDGNLIFNKFDKDDELCDATLEQGLNIGRPDKIYWYERPWIKKSRQLYAGQYSRFFDMSVLPSKYINRIGLRNTPIIYTPHHGSHAAAGYYTSPFNHCCVVVLDAIGEWECASIWQGNFGELKKVWSRSYPNSLGLFYSAFTDLCGFVPIQEEYKLQALSEQGDPFRYYREIKNYFNGIISIKNNFHKGVKNWPHEINETDKADIAAAVQQVLEEQVGMIMAIARSITKSDSLVYMGGVAMNSKANKKFVEPQFKFIWSLPQPGDPSSSIGAVLYHTKQRVWDHNLGVVKHIEIRV